MKDLQQEIEEMEVALASMKRKLEATPKYLQRAKKESPYFMLDASGCTYASKEDEYPADRKREDIGNYFPEEAHADALSKHRHKWGKVERLIIEFNNGWEPDWDEEQTKGIVTYDHNGRRWDIQARLFLCSQGVIHSDYSRKDELIELLNKHFPEGPK